MYFKFFLCLFFLFSEVFSICAASSEITICIDHSASRRIKEFYLVTTWDESGNRVKDFFHLPQKLYDDGTHGDKTPDDFVFSRKFLICNSQEPFSFDVYPRYPENGISALCFSTFEASASKTVLLNIPIFPVPVTPAEAFAIYGHDSSKIPFIFGSCGLIVLFIFLFKYFSGSPDSKAASFYRRLLHPPFVFQLIHKPDLENQISALFNNSLPGGCTALDADSTETAQKQFPEKLESACYSSDLVIARFIKSAPDLFCIRSLAEESMTPVIVLLSQEHADHSGKYQQIQLSSSTCSELRLDSGEKLMLDPGNSAS